MKQRPETGRCFYFYGVFPAWKVYKLEYLPKLGIEFDREGPRGPMKGR